MTELHISGDFSAVLAALSELKTLTDSLDVGPEFIDRLIGLFDSFEQFVCFESDDSAAGAGKLLVRAYPSDRFLVLLAALRAGNCDLGVLEQFGHEKPPLLPGEPTAANGESGGGGKPLPGSLHNSGGVA